MCVLKNTTLKKRLTDKGITLIEILVAVAIVGSVVAGLTLFAPRAVKAIAKVHSRSAAASLATNKVDDIKSHPYPLIPVTPDGSYFSVASTTGPCDCSNVNFTQSIPGVAAQTNPETITVGHITYTRQTCVNYIRNTPLLGWHSNCTNDTGLKEIVTNVSWMLGNEIQLYTLISLASPTSQTGTMPAASAGNVSVNICPANGLPTFDPNFSCDNTKLNLITGTEVAIYDSNNKLVAENGHILTTTKSALLSVPPGNGYTLHVQQAGYFPYHVTINIASGVIPPISVILRDFATYGSKLTGEAFVADHPVISKVVAQVADYVNNGTCLPPTSGSACQDLSEMVELYNPTKTVYKFGSGGDLQLVYCNSASCSTPAFAGTNLAAGSFLLIEGLDPLRAAPNSDWPSPPDISYTVGAGTEGLIPYKSGGGIQLQWYNGTSWVTVNEVHWKGQDGSSPATPPSPGVPWVGPGLPWPAVQPVICR